MKSLRMVTLILALLGNVAVVAGNGAISGDFLLNRNGPKTFPIQNPSDFLASNDRKIKPSSPATGIELLKTSK
jgi:hypothetical protein